MVIAKIHQFPPNKTPPILLHVQHIILHTVHPHSGYPIVNDPVYNNSAWGSGKGKGGVDPSNMENVRTMHTQQITCNDIIISL